MGQSRGLRHLILGVVLCVGVVGCSHHGKHGKNGQGGASTYGAGDGAGVNGADAGDMLAKRKVYFAYDRSELNGSERQIVDAHADFLKQNPNRHVRIEGHTDEQGSREYNIALGERRARAVAHEMTANGVAPHQISTVSFGKEKPDSNGHSEEAHGLNRRAVIVYEE